LFLGRNWNNNTTINSERNISAGCKQNANKAVGYQDGEMQRVMKEQCSETITSHRQGCRYLLGHSRGLKYLHG